MTTKTQVFPSLLNDKYNSTKHNTVSLNLEMIAIFDEEENYYTQKLILPTERMPTEIKDFIAKQSYLMVATKHMEFTYAMFAELISRNNQLSQVLIEMIFDVEKRKSFKNFVYELEGHESPHKRLTKLSNHYYK